MSVLIITTSISGKSGIEKSVISTANLLSRNGMDVTIATISNAAYNGRVFTYPTAFELDDKVKRFSLKEYPLETPYSFEKRNKIVLDVKHKYYKTSFSEYDVEVVRDIDKKLTNDDVVIFAASMAAQLFSIANIKPKYKTIMQIHSDYAEDSSNREHLMKALNVIEIIQPVSSEMVPYLVELTGFNKDKIIPIYNVLNFSDDKPCLEKTLDTKFRISIVGSLQERKNQMDALKIMEQLSNDYILQVYGAPNGDYYTEMFNYISDNNLSEKVKFMGYKSETEIYSETDLLIITAKSEGFGYTLLEAAYYGIPSVTYDYKYGANEVIEDGINGYLINFNDIDNFSEKIKKLKEDKELYNKFSKNIQNTFFTKFSASKIFHDYQKVLGNQSGNKMFDNKFINTEMLDFKIEYSVSKTRMHNISFEIPKYIDIENKQLYALIYGKKVKLNATIEKNWIHAQYFSRFKYAFTYIFLEDKNGYQTYLFNINSKGNVEKIKIYSKYETTNKVNLIKRNTRLGITWIENPRNKSVVSIISTKENTSIDFSIEKKMIDGYFTEVIKYDSIENNITIQYDDLKININVPFKDELDYKYVFDRLTKLEESKNLFDFKIDGIYIWEIIRPNLVIRIMQDNQMFKYNKKSHSNSYFDISPKKFDSKGKNLICNTTSDVDLYSTIVDNTFDIQTTDKYSYVDLTKTFGKQVELVENINFKDFEVNEMDKVEQLLSILISENFNISENYIKNDIITRIKVFKAQYKYYNELFKKRKYNKVYIVSSVWTPGIVQAAIDNNVTSYEVQYALATKYHLNYGINKELRNYKTDVFLSWSDFWSSKNLFSDKQEVIQNKRKIERLKELTNCDVAFVSQHLLTQYSIKYLNNFAKHNPDLKIAYLAHPKEDIPSTLLSENDNISVFIGYTDDAILVIDKIIGMFSTVLYDAAYLGKDVYVIDVPGSVIVEEEFFKKLDFDEYDIN